MEALHALSSEVHMDQSPSFFSRVLSNEATRKGLAGAVAGILVGTVLEIVWPTR